METTAQQSATPPTANVAAVSAIGGTLIISAAIAVAVVRGRGLKFGKLEVSAWHEQANRDKWELSIQSGFTLVIRASNGALKDFLSRGIERFFMQSFIAVLKERGVPHHRIRYNTDVVRYETVLGLSIRKIVIPGLLLTFFQNHIPEKADLKSSDSEVRDAARDWYRRKFVDVMGDSRDFITGKWPVDGFAHGEVVDAYMLTVFDEVLPLLIDMYEKVRVKRVGIFQDMQKEIKELSPAVVSKRWEEIFLLGGYINILEG